MRSYERFGQRKPIVARKTGGTARAPRGVVIAGNHQLEAARQLGWKKIAVVWTTDDELTAKAFAIADNRTSDLAVYDDQALGELLADLVADDQGLLEASGWDRDAVAELLADIDRASAEAEEIEQHPDKGNLLAVSDVAIHEPINTTHHLDHWVFGDRHHLIVCDPMSEWGHFIGYLSGEALLVPYAGPYAVLSKRAESEVFVMVQPDAYIAGHIVDKWKAINGDTAVLIK